MRTNSEIKNIAYQALQGKWAIFALITFVYMFLIYIGSSISFLIDNNIPNYLWMILTLPLGWGIMVIFLRNLRKEKKIQIENLFDGYNDFVRISGTGFLMVIYIFLWSLLLVIPGIVKVYSYLLTYYILKDNPKLSMNAAIERSMAMMKGHKMQAFLLTLSFIGWLMLAILTCGIGLLFLIPYIYSSFAALYEDIKDSCENEFRDTDMA